MIGQNVASLDMLDKVRSWESAGQGRSDSVAASEAIPISAEIRPLADIDAVYGALETLAANAAEPNIFFEPAVLKAAAEEHKHPDRLHLVLVWDGAPGERLVGAMPVEVERHRWGPFLAVTQVWNHKMGVRGTPLILPGRAAAFWAQALDALGKSTLPNRLLMHAMTSDGEGMAGLETCCADTGRHMRTIEVLRYISLKTDLDGEAYLSKTMSSRRRRRMRKAERDLAEMGSLECKCYRDEKDVMPAFFQFLELEAAGWKGRGGTAIMMKPDALRFFLRAIAAFARRGSVQIDSLELDGRPIGMSVVIISGHTAFCWKTSYDESLANYNPGFLTVMDVTRRIIANPAVTFADSCTDEGHPMMETMWSEKNELADVLIDTRPAHGTAGIRLGIWLEKTRRYARGKAKVVYHALRARLAARRKTDQTASSAPDAAPTTPSE